MSDGWSAAAQSLQRFGSSLTQNALSIYEIDARQKGDIAELEIATELEQLKRDLMRDPNHGTPGENNGYMAKWEEKQAEIQEKISKIDNPLAKKRVEKTFGSLAAAQTTAIYGLQYNAWGRDIVAQRTEMNRRLVEEGALPTQQTLDMIADNISFLAQNNLMDQAEADKHTAVWGQEALTRDLERRAKEAYKAGGLSAAEKTILEDETVYTVGGMPVRASDAAKKYVQEKITAINGMATREALDTYARLTTDQKDEKGNVIQNGLPGVEAIEVIKASLPGEDSDKKPVIDELKDRQAVGEWSRAYSLFNEHRTDPAQLQKDFMQIKKDSARYTGIEDTHKKILDMFEGQISDLASAEGKGASKALDASMIASETAYNKGLMTQDALQRSVLEDLAAGGSAGTASRIIADSMTKDKPQYKPIVESYMAAFDVSIARAGDKKSGSGLAKSELTQAMNDGIASLRDMMRDGASIPEFTKAKDQLIAVQFAKEFDSVRATLFGGVQQTTFDPEGLKQEAEVVERIQKGQLDDVVFSDDGTIGFVGGAGTGLLQIMSRQEQRLKDMGIDVQSSTFAPQGSRDVGATMIYTDKSGAKYSFQAEKGKVIPVKLVGKEWQKIDVPKKIVPNIDAQAEARQVQAQEKLQSETARHFVSEIKGIKDPWERRMRMMDIIGTMNGQITWQDFEQAGYDRKGNYVGENRKPAGGGR